MKYYSSQQRVSKSTTKKFSMIGSRGQCYKIMLQKTIVSIIMVIFSAFEELI